MRVGGCSSNPSNRSLEWSPAIRSREQFIQALQVRRLQGMRTYKEERQAADC